MSLTPTFPGVYLQEIPSGDYTVTPVSTSVAAFVGRALCGPVDEVMVCYSFGDFTRIYGGLQVNYPMSYAVRDFFANGGAQCNIARLFEPAQGSGSGVAQLPFPPSPPMVPQGWLLAAPAAAGTSTLQLTPPVGSEGDPIEGMVFALGNQTPPPYLITNYTPPKGNAPASIAFVPALTSPVAAPYPVCTPLTFQQGPAIAGWNFASLSSGSVTATAGIGIPELGDNFQVGTDPTVYTVTQQPVVSMPPAIGLQIVFSFTPKPAASWIAGSSISFTPPMPSPMPLQWQVTASPTGSASGYTIPVANGTGAPLVNDQFTVGTNTTIYTVTGFTPAVTGAKPAPAQVKFVVANGLPLPTAPGAFCFCCQVVFTRPVPSNYTIGKAPKIGDVQFTVASSAATSGVIDLGYTFLVQGDPTVYTVVLYSQSSGQISFLPEAETAFSGLITFSPPLQLVAASPGSWGNMLTASVDTVGIPATLPIKFTQYGLEPEDLFNLTLTLTNSSNRVISQEKYASVSIKQAGMAGTYPNRLDYVLTAQSMLAQVGVMPLAPPVSGSAAIGSGGNDGEGLSVPTYLGNQSQGTGMYLLNEGPAFNLLCIPPDQRLFPGLPLAMQDLDPQVRTAAARFCTDQRAVFIADPPAIWETKVANGATSTISPSDLGISGLNAAGIEIKRNVAVYFPRINAEDMLLNNTISLFPACGMVAGVIAATDVARGVWKSPAGTDASLSGVTTLNATLNDTVNGLLNPMGINCLRTFPSYGTVVWGARTLMGADQLQDDYKYLSVRRLTLFVESSLYVSTQWAVFEPNDEALWSALRLSVNSFLADLSRRGAFYNYLVACDASTTTPLDIANGVVNIMVQIAPVKPAEFVMITIQQTMATASS